MSFVVGEVDVSPESTKNIASQVVNPLSTQLQRLATQVGQRYVLLDSVRDAALDPRDARLLPVFQVAPCPL